MSDALLPVATRPDRVLRGRGRTWPGGLRFGAPAWRNLPLVLPFLCLYVVNLAHHQLWRDEMNPSALALESPSLRVLLHRVHYEAHPALWYVLLYGASRISPALWMFKLVQGMVGATILVLLACTTPFRRRELLLVFLGYFAIFQYTVLCRMYGLEWLLALLYVRGRTWHPERLVRNSVWLALMANVDLSGAILAAGLLGEALYDTYAERQRYPRAGAKIGAALGVFAVALAISLASLWPAPDLGWRTTGPLLSRFLDAGHAADAFLKWIVAPWYPGAIEQVSSWSPTSAWPELTLWPVVLVCLWAVFRRERRLGCMLAGIGLTGVLFSEVTNVAGVRHTGILYLAFLAALAMMRFEQRRVSPMAYVLLGLTVWCGLRSEWAQWRRPFVDDDATARWMLAQHLEDEPLFGTGDTNVMGVPERLHRPMYQLECSCLDRVLTFSNRRDAFRPETDVPARLLEGMAKLQTRQGLLLMSRPVRTDEQQQILAGGVQVRLDAVFDRGSVADEHFWVYSIRALPQVCGTLQVVYGVAGSPRCG